MTPTDSALHYRGWLGRIAALANHRHSRWALAAIAFADSSFLPVPPDLLLVPMALFRPDRLRLLLIIATAFSTLGAAVGYLIGYELWSNVGAPLVAFYDCAEGFERYRNLIAIWGIWMIIAKAFTPVPFKIAAIAAGVVAMEPVSFMLATLVGRALHFAMVGALLRLFGERLVTLMARYERRVVLASLVALAGAFVILRMI